MIIVEQSRHPEWMAGNFSAIAVQKGRNFADCFFLIVQTHCTGLHGNGVALVLVSTDFRNVYTNSRREIRKQINFLQESIVKATGEMCLLLRHNGIQLRPFRTPIRIKPAVSYCYGDHALADDMRAMQYRVQSSKIVISEE